MQTRFMLIGDSNSGVIGHAAKTAQLPFVAGPIAIGRRVDDLFFDVDENGVATFHEDIQQNRRYTAEDMLDPQVPVLSTLGFNMQRIGQAMLQYLRAQKIELGNISEAVMQQGMEDYKAGPLAYYREAARRGVKVYACLSPQRFPASYFDIAITIEQRFQAMIEDLGVTIVDIRKETTDENGRLLPEYFTERENDKTHSNEAWGKIVLDRFFELRAAEAVTA